MAKCMQCGGMKKAKVGTVVTDEPTKREVRQAMRKDKKIDRQDKRFMRQYEKQKAEEMMKSDRWKTAGTGKATQMKKGGITQNIVGMPGYNATTRPITMKKGGAKLQKRADGGPNKIPMIGSAKSKADKATIMNPGNKYALGGSSRGVQSRCPGTTVRMADGSCGSERPRFGG